MCLCVRVTPTSVRRRRRPRRRRPRSRWRHRQWRQLQRRRRQGRRRKRRRRRRHRRCRKHQCRRTHRQPALHVGAVIDRAQAGARGALPPGSPPHTHSASAAPCVSPKPYVIGAVGRGAETGVGGEGGGRGGARRGVRTRRAARPASARGVCGVKARGAGRGVWGGGSRARPVCRPLPHSECQRPWGAQGSTPRPRDRTIVTWALCQPRPTMLGARVAPAVEFASRRRAGDWGTSRRRRHVVACSTGVENFSLRFEGSLS